MTIEFKSYDMSVASSAAAASVFSGTWTTDFSEIGLPDTGTARLLGDHRLKWLEHQVGSLQGFDILELGSFEGAHSLSFANMGARSCVGIEANAQHFMRSLVVKNHVDASQLKFLLGDFNAYMAESGESFDLVSACGVLYHMTNPAETIALAAKRSRRLFIWTVLYDEEQVPPEMTDKLEVPSELVHEGFAYTGRRHNYQMPLAQALHKDGKFSGGSQAYAIWLEYEELKRILEHYGYEVKAAAHGGPDNGQPGGDVTLYAEIPG